MLAVGHVGREQGAAVRVASCRAGCRFGALDASTATLHEVPCPHGDDQRQDRSHDGAQDDEGQQADELAPGRAPARWTASRGTRSTGRATYPDISADVIALGPRLGLPFLRVAPRPGCQALACSSAGSGGSKCRLSGGLPWPMPTGCRSRPPVVGLAATWLHQPIDRAAAATGAAWHAPAGRDRGSRPRYGCAPRTAAPAGGPPAGRQRCASVSDGTRCRG